NLPPPQTISNPDGTKTLIEYRFNDDGKKVKVTRKIRIVPHAERMTKAAAERKRWKKFGAAKGHGPGPNTDTTSVGEAVFLKLTANPKSLDAAAGKQDDSLKAKLASAKNISCRICNGNHWTSKCPYKDTLVTGATSLETPADEEKEEAPVQAPSAGDKPAKYVPPSLRDRAAGKEVEGSRDDTFAIRISNLSEDTTDQDLQQLVRVFGSVARSFLAKDHETGNCKGYAFVNYHRKDDAERAINALDGHGYANLILRAEWAKYVTLKPF
ncbi:eukaryotic translation initiation factor 3 subunit G-domain-containing protein, partial [Paraphysoderma sedebokerense]